MRITKNNNGITVNKALKIEMFDNNYFVQSTIVREVLSRVPAIQKRMSEFFVESRQDEVLVTASKTYLSFDGINHLLDNIIAKSVTDADNCVDWQQEFKALRRDLLVTPIKVNEFPIITPPKFQKYSYKNKTPLVDFSEYCIRTCVPFAVIRTRLSAVLAEAGLRKGEDFYHTGEKNVIGYYSAYARHFLTLSGCFKLTSYLLDIGHDERRMHLGMLSLFYSLTNNQLRIKSMSPIEYVKQQLAAYRRPLYDGDISKMDPNALLAIHAAKKVTKKQGLFEKLEAYKDKTLSVTGLACIAEIDEMLLRDTLIAFHAVVDYNGILVPHIVAAGKQLVVPDDTLEFERFRITWKGALEFAGAVINQMGANTLKQNA